MTQLLMPLRHYDPEDETDLHNQFRVVYSHVTKGGEEWAQEGRPGSGDRVADRFRRVGATTVLRDHLAAGTTFEDFRSMAQLNAQASLIAGVVCGVRVKQIEDPMMQKIRYLDKLVD